MTGRAAVVLIALLGCERPDAAEPDRREQRSAFATATEVTRVDTAGARTFRVAPLRPMGGDVEVLFGDPEAAGEPFVMRIRELAGTRVPPHTHPVDEHITVVSGTWYFGTGDTWDSTALRPLQTGDYAFAPAGSSMFAYAPDEAVVQVHGIGPFRITWRHGSRTLDEDARAFRFRRTERVRSPKGSGVIVQGYASGDIIQYQIEGDVGEAYMANESELRPAD